MFETLTLGLPFFLLLLPLFILLNYFREKQSNRYYMPHLKLYKKQKISVSLLHPILKWFMIFFTVFSLCNPIYYKDISVTKNNSIDIVLALDNSGSMSLYGFNPKAYHQTRLDVVKKVVSSFIEQRTNDRIGLVVFGTHSAIASPLSFDKIAQKYIVQNLKIGSLGKSTALIDSIVSSIKLLKESTSHSKIIILLSDGEDSSSIVPLPIALKLAKKYGIKIYTILIDKSASDIMKTIAKSNHTKSYNPKDKQALEEVYNQINQLERSQVSYQNIAIPQHIYSYFLALALLCGFILLVLAKEKEVL